MFAHYFESLAGNLFQNYPEVLARVSLGNIPEGYVPTSQLFAFDEAGKIVGRVSIRHKLNESLLQIGGHIGYGVVPSERRKGYATEILKASLDYVREHLPGLDRVLLTCSENNPGSIRTIEKNGGQLENVFKTAEMTVGKCRYWITLS